MPVPPAAARKPARRVHHGDSFLDNYEWLREKENPEVLAHLEAENAYTDEVTADLAPLRADLFAEIKRHTQETDLSVPVREGSWWYYSRTVEGSDYPIHCRVTVSGDDDWEPPTPGEPGVGALEQVLLDSNLEANGHEFFSLGSFDVSSNGARMLYGVDTSGDERYRLRVRDIATGTDLPDDIQETFGGAVFDATGRFVFYTTVDPSWRPDSVWRHEVGTAASDDVRIHHEHDERFWVGVGLTRSRRYLVIEAGSSITSEAWTLDAENPTGDFTVVWPRKDGVEYSVEHAVIDGDDRLLVVHNDGAADFEVADVPAAAPLQRERILLPHTPGTRVESVEAFASHLVLEYRRDALPRVAVMKLQSGRAPTGGAVDSADSGWQELTFDEPLFSVGAGSNPEWNQPTVRLHYTSFVTPAKVCDYDVDSRDLRTLKQQPVLDYDPSRLVQRREWVTGDDGTRIPLSLVYRADLIREGEPAPTLLYGYGSYEHSIDPGFSIPRISLLDRGVIFAVAHVRGGGELGRAWYENGKTLTKMNTFTDFVACARHLVDTGWTAGDRLFAEGGSAGGLLMGAVANLAPDAFAGILAAVPFVDPLTSILDPSLPLTVIEWDEWGDPLHNEAVYRLMKSYSPYENVRDAAYPPVLAVTSLNDTRVLYVEPAKWVARLREVGAPALLRTEMSAGHGGVSGRYDSWHRKAFEYSWVLQQLRADSLQVPADARGAA